MFLKQLTLKGFKSFADVTSLDLEPGITVVVGPNGSGKSNIVDAVAWVLGAQGARTIRSNKMEDVIFAGSAKRTALGRAEVSLTIDNHSGTLPIGFVEVTITRVLFRSGESEYSINGVPCRLLDIQELLSDTGVGRQQHVIVSQGQLASILDSRPEDRRAVIEEAAGVLKFRKRRERAQRRLEATEQNFVRLGDLLREIRRQLRPLEKQAESARRYDEMHTELRALRLHLAGRELADLAQRGQTTTEGRREIGGRIEEGRLRLNDLESGVLSAEGALSALSGSAEESGSVEIDPGGWGAVDLGAALARCESLHQKALGMRNVLVERRRSIERDRAAFIDQDVVASLETESAKLVVELQLVANEALALPPLFDDLTEQERVLAGERNHFLEEWGNEMSPAGTDQGPTAAQVRERVAATRATIDRLNSELARGEQRLQQLRERANRLDSDRTSRRVDLDALVEVVESADGLSELEAVVLAQASAERGVANAEDAAEATEDRLREADGERRNWLGRAEALQSALDAARARAGAQRLADIDGVVGTLLDLVDVDAGYETAFEAALGEAVSSVVVRDIAVARHALTLLHEADVSGAVLALGAASHADVVPLVAGAGEVLRRHVRAADPSVGRALDALLANAVVIDATWEAAVDLATRHPSAIVVTRTGSRFSQSGWRAGAGLSGATGAALEEARTAASAATAATADADTAVKNARRVLHEARQTAAAARTAVMSLTAERDKLAARLASLRDQLPRLDNDHLELTNEIGVLEGQQAERGHQAVGDAAHLRDLDNLLPKLVEAENDLAKRQALRREASQRLDQRTTAVSALRRELEVKSAGIEERERMLSGRRAEVEQRLSRSLADREVAEVRRVELEQLALRTDRLHGLVDSRVGVLESGLNDLRERRRRQTEAARDATQRLEGLRRERTATENQLTQLRERQQRLEIEDAELRLRLETLTEQVRREFEVDPATAIAAPCPPLANNVPAKTRAADLERDLRQLGPINPLALEEYNELSERNALIEGQLEDVKNSRRELTKVITAIDEEIGTVFNAAYADVAENFSSLFTTLFPGGEGRLRLTEAENPLDAGVEVEARPSGKNVRKLSLLSGGERSLTALAFLFAVFRSRPSPFYLMDEVEAALDDVNLARFVRLLQEFRQEAQLVVVSHQRRTMEAADLLYGVTMQPGGSSKCVSEKIAARA